MKLPSDSQPRVDGDLSNWTTTVQPSPGDNLLSAPNREREYLYAGRRVSTEKVPYDNDKSDK